MKICLIGETSIGKTCLCNSMLGADFDKFSEPTIGASFYSKKLKNFYDDKIHIWDTAGQERYRSLSPMYTRDCDIIMLILHKIDCWRNNFEYWIRFYLKNCDNNTQLMIVFSKMDIVEKAPDNNDILYVENILTQNNLKSKILFHSSKNKTGNIEIEKEIINLSKNISKYRKKTTDIKYGRDEYWCCNVM